MHFYALNAAWRPVAVRYRSVSATTLGSTFIRSHDRIGSIVIRGGNGRIFKFMATENKAQHKRIKSRHIAPATKILLAARSGGRCEFSGCNRDLFEHPLTLQDGNFSEHAHIVAFSELGPRGKQSVQPHDINSSDNLMLLCAPCHKLIDDRPDEYPREVLEAYKRDHEDRIRLVTGLGPDLRTTVMQLKAKIAGDAVDIPATHIYEAVAPRYPTDKRGYVIDLTSFGQDDVDEYYQLAGREIKQKVRALYEPGMDVESTRHISLFALGAIPLLMLLGRCLSNKVSVDLYQRHRTGDQPWKWKTSGQPVDYEIRLVRKGNDKSKVGLLLSLSGVIDPGSVPLNKEFYLYEITLSTEAPSVHFLRQRADLETFRVAYRNFLAELMTNHPGLSELHMFPAVPAPVAVACGHDLLPKIHPVLVTYDYDRNLGGFNKRMRVNDPANL